MSGRPTKLSLLNHQEKLLQVALRLCRQPADAEDLVQETFSRALQAEASFASGSNEGAWLVRILTNQFIDRCRSEKRKRTTELSDKIPAPEEKVEDLPQWTQISSEQLLSAVTMLEQPFQDVYRLQALEGRSYAEISEQLSIPIQTVGSRMSRARQRLKQLLLKKLEESGRNRK